VIVKESDYGWVGQNDILNVAPVSAQQQPPKNRRMISSIGIQQVKKLEDQPAEPGQFPEHQLKS